jgi:predicted dehydrogenase
MAQLGIGLIGTGFMGACHALAFRAAPAVFETKLGARLELVADVAEAPARAAAERFGFARWTTDWRAVVEDPAVDLVSVATPNVLHKEMALAAIAAGKHVYCEKPLALTAADAGEMAAAARGAGIRTLVGYNYLRAPVVDFARQLIEEGAIGRPTYVRSCFDEDYMADPTVPLSWRCRRAEAGSGALGDMGSHLIAALVFLFGPIAEVCADAVTVIPERPLPADPGRERRDAAGGPVGTGRGVVENEDILHAMLLFESGLLGGFGTSRIACGRKNHLALEIFGSDGAILLDQERMNELELYQTGSAANDRNGFRRVFSGPQHPHYGAFVPATGHGLGFNDLKVIEVAHLLDGIATGAPLHPDFEGGWRIEQVADALLASAERRAWVRVGDHA